MILPGMGRAQQGRDPNWEKPTDVRIRLTFNDLVLIAALYDSPSARDLASMLPLSLKIEDYGSSEKIVRLPRKLIEDGSGPFGNERPGDLCYFKPWGNLALFYDDYRWDGLIRLGRFDGGYEALRVRGEYPVHIKRI
ncbi:cyclophilin-like fold protein [Pararhizobium polonicum]|nr:cyclophilin-like fold protein [Pararhizobium polonicum]